MSTTNTTTTAATVSNANTASLVDASYKMAQIPTNAIFHGENHGRKEAILFNPVLLTSIFQVNHTDSQPLLVVEITRDEARELHAKSQANLDGLVLPEKGFTVSTSSENEEVEVIKHLINKSDLNLPAFDETLPKYYQVYAGHCRLNVLQIKQIMTNQTDLNVCRVVDDIDQAKKLSILENGIATTGRTDLTNFDVWAIGLELLKKDIVGNEKSFYTALGVTRAYGQKLFGLAQKCKAYKKLESMVRKHQVPLAAPAEGMEQEYLDLKRVPNTLTGGLKKVTTFEDTLRVITEKVKVKGEKAPNAVSGAVMREIAGGATGEIAELLMALAGGEEQKAREAVTLLSFKIDSLND